MRADTAAIAVGSAERDVAFGPFTFNRLNRLLSKDGVEVPLPPRVLGVLTLLLEKPGQVVTKQELIGAVWRDAFVTETSLAEAVSLLRQTLGDDPQRPTYVQTLHRRGYRFIAEVKDLPVEGDLASRLDSRSDATHRSAGDRSPEAGTPIDLWIDRGARPQEGAIEQEPRLSLLVPWTITLFAVLIATVAVWNYVNTAAPAPRPPTRLTMALPGGVVLSSSGGPVAVSEDGLLVAFAGCQGSDCGIYLRPLSQADATLVAGTAGGSSPFFSRDGRWIGYFANGQLLKIRLGGGSPVVLAAVPQPLGGTWARDGVIVFAGAPGGGLSSIPANGGPVQSMTTPGAGEGDHRWPDVLPDGSAVIFTVTGDEAHRNQHYAAALSLRRGGWGRLLDGVSAARAGGPGHLIAQRGSDLVGAAFDHRALSVAGLPIAVSRGEIDADGSPQFAMSAAGTLAVGRRGASALHIVADWGGELRRLIPAPEPTMPR